MFVFKENVKTVLAHWFEIGLAGFLLLIDETRWFLFFAFIFYIYKAHHHARYLDSARLVNFLYLQTFCVTLAHHFGITDEAFRAAKAEVRSNMPPEVLKVYDDAETFTS